MATTPRSRSLGVVGEVLVEAPPSAPRGCGGRGTPRIARSLGLDRRALLGDPRADPVDLEVDVHAVGDGLLVAVLHDEVLVEEAERVLRGRGGEADEVGVEVLEHLPPERVDRAVALVDDDDVEELGRVAPGCRRRGAAPAARAARPSNCEPSSSVGVEVGLALEHRVEPLDGRDDDLGSRRRWCSR